MKAKPFDLLSATSLGGDNVNQASSTNGTKGTVPLKPVSVSEPTNGKSDLKSNKIERPAEEMKETSPGVTAVSTQVDNTSNKEGGSLPDTKMTEETPATLEKRADDHDTAMENNEIIEQV